MTAARRLTLGTLVGLCTLVGVVLLGSAPALAARPHVFSTSFGGEGAGNGQFSNPAGVAVAEASGDVYVVDKGNDRVEYFNSTGSFIGQFDGSAAPSGVFSSPETVAVDNSANPLDPSAGDVYVTDTGHKAIDKFSANGSYLGQLTETTGGALFGEIYGAAVDQNGVLWVYQASGEIDQFSEALVNEFLSSRLSPYGTSPGLAVDSEDDLYVNRGGVVAKLNSGGEAISETVDPEQTTDTAVDLANNNVFFGNLSTLASYTANGSPIENFGSGRLSSSAGIAVTSLGETVYAADSAANVVDVFVLEAAGTPVVQDESVATVTATSATFRAQVNPHGASTEYRFEYGHCASLAACASSGYEGSVPLPEGSAGSEFGFQNVSGHPQDLLASTAYHFRIVAHNEYGTTDGVEDTLHTQPLGVASGLADGRAWEMVSPPQKEGSLFGHIEEGIIQAAADGNAFTDESSFEPIEEKAAGAYGLHEANFFGRGPDGWASKTITPPHSTGGRVPLGNGQEYRFFSEDLSKGILQPFGPATPLASGVSESTPYLRTDFLNGNPGELCGTGCFQPLVSDANVPAGTRYGEEGEGPCASDSCGPMVVAVSPDLSDVLLQSPVALTAGSAGGLYEWASGKLAFVGVGGLGSGGLFRHVISDDGSRVFLNGSYEGVEGLLMRDAAMGETIRLDVAQGSRLPPVPPGQAVFETASSDGSRVFFTSAQPLTEDASEPALYEYNLNAPTGSHLTDLSVDENAGEAAGVSSVLGASEDGSYVYFTASGALAPGASPGKCGNEIETHLCNLYVRHDGKTTFVAGVDAEDSPTWRVQEGNGLSARVSPNGQWLAFMSNRNLTGYDTSDAVSGRPDEEVFLYDASANKLVCASCNSTGARPVGVEYGKDARIVGGDRVFSPGTWIASNVPPWTRFDALDANYQSRYLSDSGRLFFDSHDALVSQDVNGTQDVYEYEPDGTGDCGGSQATFSETSGGCVSLVSSGESNEESAFLDASETGGDVFFLTVSKLVARDFDNAYDIYDARECGSGRCLEPEPVSPPACNTGDSCKPAPTPQPAIFGSPSSATFTGAGNITLSSGAPVVKAKGLTRAQRLARALKVCHREKGRRRKTCKRQAHVRYGAKKSRKANATRRSGR